MFEEQAPPRQAGELRWGMMGITVRVLPSFWFISGLLAWVFIGRVAQGNALLIAIGLDVASIFIALLFTKLVQSLVYRSYGLYSTIVIQDFGGLVIPEAEPLHRLQRIVVALASPFSCFLLYAVVYYTNREFNWAANIPPFTQFVYFILTIVGLFWGIIGLLPIYPYPGGRVMLEVFTYFSNLGGLLATLIISIVIGVAYIVYYIAVDITHTIREIPIFENFPLPASMFVAIFFGMATLRNIQLLQQVRAQTRSYRVMADDQEPWENR